VLCVVRPAREQEGRAEVLLATAISVNAGRPPARRCSAPARPVTRTR
jgi:hypothetical protein